MDHQLDQILAQEKAEKAKDAKNAQLDKQREAKIAALLAVAQNKEKSEA